MEIAFKQVYDNNVQNHILWYMLFFKKLNKTINGIWVEFKSFQTQLLVKPKKALLARQPK